MTELDDGECLYEIREDLNGNFHILDLVRHERIATFNLFQDALTFARQAVLSSAKGKSDVG